MQVLLRRRTEFVASALTVLALVAIAPTAAAQEEVSGRDAILQVAGEYRQLLDVYHPGGAYQGAFEQMSRQLEALTPEEIEAYEQVFGSIAARARTNLAVMKIVLRHRDMAIHRQQRSTGFPDADLSTIHLEGLWGAILDEFQAPELPGLGDLWDWITGGALGGIPDLPLFPESAVPLYCPGDLDSDGLPDREDPEVLMALQFGLQVLELRWQIAGRICDQDLGFVAVVVGGGGISGNLSFACIVEDLFYFPLRNLFDNMLACEAYYDGQELEASYLKLGHIHDDISTHDNDISTQLATHDNDISTQLATHDGDIKSQVALHDFDIKGLLDIVIGNQNRGFRAQVEAALRDDKRQAIFYLPPPMGNLDTVQQIVDETIASVTASGEQSYRATQMRDVANRLAADGMYKRAFNFYSLAYFEAVKLMGERR